MTTIFIIHLCVHFLGASTAQPGVKRPGNLQFSDLEEISVQKRHGNLNNIRICNGKVQQILAKKNGVLAVECLSNNGGHVKPPVGSLSFNINVEIPIHKSGGDIRDPNIGITTLVELYGGGDAPNVTVTLGEDNNIIDVLGVDANTLVRFFS